MRRSMLPAAYPSEPWPDTWTLVSIDTRTPSTRPTLVSIDTPPTLLRHSSDTLRHSNPAIQTGEMRASCLSSVNSVKLRHSDTSDTADTPDTPTLDTPTRSGTTHAAVPGHRSSGPRTQVQRSQDTGPAVPGHTRSSSGPRTQVLQSQDTGPGEKRC